MSEFESTIKLGEVNIGGVQKLNLSGNWKKLAFGLILLLGLAGGILWAKNHTTPESKFKDTISFVESQSRLLIHDLENNASNEILCNRLAELKKGSELLWTQSQVFPNLLPHVYALTFETRSASLGCAIQKDADSWATLRAQLKSDSKSIRNQALQLRVLAAENEFQIGKTLQSNSEQDSDIPMPAPNSPKL